MVFLIIGGVGLAALLLSLLLGGLFGIDSVLDNDIFSLATLSAFCGAFGFTGVAVESLRAGLVAAIGIGVVAGVLLVWFTVWLTRRLKRTQSDGTVSTHPLVGREATVLTAIPAGGHGEIVVRIGGQRVKYAARAEAPVAEGTAVWVSGVLSPTAVEVRVTDAIEA